MQSSRRAARHYHALLLDPSTKIDFFGGDPSGYYSFYDYQKLAVDNYPLQVAMPAPPRPVPSGFPTDR